jgi:transposase
MHVIGEDCSQRLDLIPAQYRVIVTRRPKYACRTCQEGVVQAPAPARLIEGGLPIEQLVAHVVVAKYADPGATRDHDRKERLPTRRLNGRFG